MEPVGDWFLAAGQKSPGHANLHYPCIEKLNGRGAEGCLVALERISATVADLGDGTGNRA